MMVDNYDLNMLRDKLNEMVSEDASLYEGEILRVSQELDKLITLYYKEKDKDKQH